jgi:hypothetical protein
VAGSATALTPVGTRLSADEQAIDLRVVAVVALSLVERVGPGMDLLQFYHHGMGDDRRLMVAPRHEPARQHRPAVSASAAAKSSAAELRLVLGPSREHHRRRPHAPPVRPHASTTARRTPPASSSPTAALDAEAALGASVPQFYMRPELQSFDHIPSQRCGAPDLGQDDLFQGAGELGLQLRGPVSAQP